MTTAIYARISSDVEGRGLGVERQVSDCTAKAHALGWTDLAPYVDNDVSASKKVPRPQFNRLIDDIESGTVKALVVYDLDRLTRKMTELETFIDLANAHGLLLANVSGDVDLTNANGRMIARIKGAVARQEAERIAERTERQKRQYAESGKRLGGPHRVFGYDRGWNVVESEAQIVREIFSRIIKGESQNAITRDLQARDVRTVTGILWRPLNTSRVVKNELYAGINMYKGERLGRMAFDALIDEATYEAVNNSKPTSPTAVAKVTRRYLLSSILICGVCKAPMSGGKDARGVGRYRCDSRTGGCGRVSIKSDWCDDLVNAWMSQISVIDRLKAPVEVKDNSALIAELDERIEYLQGSGLDLEDLVPMLKKARKERQALVKDDAERIEVDMFAPVGEYAALDVAGKRGRIATRIKHIEVKPGMTGPKFNPYRLLIHFQNGDVKPGPAIDVNDWRDPDQLAAARAESE